MLSTAVFLNDLLDQGYKPQHIRFYLINGDYREKKTFVYEEIEKSSKELDCLRKLISNFYEASKRATKSEDNATSLIHKIVSSFEDNMNDDLNVKEVFIMLNKILSELNSCRKLGKLSGEECRMIIEELRKIDEVLKVLFD